MANKIVFVLPNSGSGTRFGSDVPKQYVEINGKTILEWTLEKIKTLRQVDSIVLVNSESDNFWNSNMYRGNIPLHVVKGGSERSISVKNGCLKALELSGPDSWVLVHDVARPLVRISLIDELIDQCIRFNQGGILANRVPDTVKEVSDHLVSKTIDRSNLFCAQTPQMFNTARLLEAIEYASIKGIEVTDESSAIEALGDYVNIIESDRINMKLTYPEDLIFFNSVLGES